MKLHQVYVKIVLKSIKTVAVVFEVLEPWRRMLEGSKENWLLLHVVPSRIIIPEITNFYNFQ